MQDLTYKQFKTRLEKIKFSRDQFSLKEVKAYNGNTILQYDKGCDLEKNIGLQNELIRSYYKQEKAVDSYSSCNQGGKTTPQNNAFHFAVEVLLPQYNKHLAETGNCKYGKIVHNKDSFKEVLKAQAGYFRKITKEEALIYVKINLSNLKKLVPDATVEELIEARQNQKDLGRIRDCSKEKMIEILKAIDLWAMNMGFSLCISEEYRNRYNDFKNLIK